MAALPEPPGALPFVSVVVPVRNGQDTIAECLSALLALDYPENRREIVVVDNGSTDRTAEIVSGFPVRCVREERRGRAHARNRGIGEADFGVIAFTDADCIAHRSWLRELVRELGEPGVGGAGGEILAYEPASPAERFMARREPRWQSFVLSLDRPFLITANAAFTARALRRAGAFDPDFATAEDVDFGWRVRASGLELRYAPDAVVRHRLRRTAWELLRQQEGLGHGRGLLRARYGLPRGFALGTRRELFGALAALGRSLGRRLVGVTGPDELAFAWYDVLVRVALRVGALRCAAGRLVPRPPPILGPAAMLASRAVLRTERSPLRPFWRLSYAAIARGAAAYLRRGLPGAAVYLKGSLVSGRPVYGLSDIDLVLVLPDSPERPARRARERALQRWERLASSVPPLGDLARHVWTYSASELAEALSAPLYLYGLDAAAPGQAALLGATALDDPLGLQDRPELLGPRGEWRLVAGPDLRPPEAELTASRRALTGWLELQYWWRYLIEASSSPADRHTAYLCAKLVAEVARVFLWVTESEETAGGPAALEAAARCLPEEEASLRHAARLYEELSRSPDPPIEQIAPVVLRLSERIAGELLDRLAAPGATPVRLVGGDHGGLALGAPPTGSNLLPLVDWHALVAPPLPDEAFELTPGDAGRPSDLAATATVDGPHRALRARHLLVFPSLPVWGRGRLRGIQFVASDPVSFALADGRTDALFPNVPGWSARDVARRAVAEHRGWLRSTGVERRGPGWVSAPPHARSATLRTLGLLFTAARAGLFLESADAGRPELALTVASVAGVLGERDTAAGPVASAALDAFHDCRRNGGDPPEAETVAFRKLVESLPAFAD